MYGSRLQTYCQQLHVRQPITDLLSAAPCTAADYRPTVSSSLYGTDYRPTVSSSLYGTDYRPTVSSSMYGSRLQTYCQQLHVRQPITDLLSAAPCTAADYRPTVSSSLYGTDYRLNVSSSLYGTDYRPTVSSSPYRTDYRPTVKQLGAEATWLHCSLNDSYLPPSSR